MKKVLVVVDLQNDFITGSLANKQAEKIIPRVADLIKDFDGDVIFTRDTHYEKYLNTNEGKHLPVEHCIKGTFGQQIHRDLLGWIDADVIDKTTFGSEKLVDHIESKVYGSYPNCEIHIVGTCTDICCIVNALLIKTRLPECKVIVHRKCCAALDEKGQRAAMLIMERCQIEIED